MNKLPSMYASQGEVQLTVTVNNECARGCSLSLLIVYELATGCKCHDGIRPLSYNRGDYIVGSSLLTDHQTPHTDTPCPRQTKDLTAWMIKGA
jgi:hypothetical protein